MDSLVQLYGMAMVVLPVVAFVSLRKRIRYEGMSRRGALARYAAQVAMPILAYGGLFALALGVEAVAPVSLVEKGVRESFALAIVLGVLVWLLSITIFALGLMFVAARRADHPGWARPLLWMGSTLLATGCVVLAVLPLDRLATIVIGIMIITWGVVLAEPILPALLTRFTPPSPGGTRARVTAPS